MHGNPSMLHNHHPGQQCYCYPCLSDKVREARETQLAQGPTGQGQWAWGLCVGSWTVIQPQCRAFACPDKMLDTAETTRNLSLLGPAVIQAPGCLASTQQEDLGVKQGWARTVTYFSPTV